MTANRYSALQDLPASILEFLRNYPKREVAAQRLLSVSPLFKRFIHRHEDRVKLMLASPGGGNYFGPGKLAAAWDSFPRDGLDFWDALRVFRRLQSLRIALREVTSGIPLEETLAELSHLADFILKTVFDSVLAEMQDSRGVPWDENLDQPASYALVALGKLGGQELNFCSDVDLLLIHEGEGHCRKNHKQLPTHNREFFSRAFSEVCRILQKNSSEGFLYNVDLRLRPEGESGPLVPSLQGIINYYFSRGQTWERLALIKARYILGSRELFGELTEMVHTFRYPRHAPASLPQDVAALKMRTENEVIGTRNLHRDIKNGHGGIREIEYFCQVLQLLQAGKYPFLQTPNTLEALNQLERYQLVEFETCRDLARAYKFFRLLENRLQMREEKPVHSIPENEQEVVKIAHSLGYSDHQALYEELEFHRSNVRSTYQGLFPETIDESDYSEWMSFFSGQQPGETVKNKLSDWFGDAGLAADAMRRFILGDPKAGITREQLQLFLDISKYFNDIFNDVADPLETLMRVEQFASQYGARKEFFKTCTFNPNLFRVLCLLFDRSEFIHSLLCKHPEIVDELLSYAGRSKKSVEHVLEDLQQGPKDDFKSWLWLYVKAEQVRIAINELLNVITPEEAEGQLSDLAEAAWRFCIDKFDTYSNLAVIALGKFGGREISLGSDLDVLVLSTDSHSPEAESALKQILKTLSFRGPMGRTFEIDLRLRPHGNDGPLLVTMDAMENYHRQRAHFWEVQLLTRARPISGNNELIQRFNEFVHNLVFSGNQLSETRLNELNHIRDRIHREKVRKDHPEWSFKNGSGGLLDIEFFTQHWVLAKGHELPSLRSPNTRTVLRSLIEESCIPAHVGNKLLDDYNYLRSLELNLRRNAHQSINEIDPRTVSIDALARWMNYPDTESFLEHHRQRLTDCREQLQNHQPPSAG